MLQAYLKLPRSLWILFAATVVNSVGMFVFPFATLFFNKHLGLDPFWTGVLVAILGLCYLPGGLIGGRIADRWGRKKITVGATVVSSLFYIPAGLLVNSHLMIPFLFLAIFFDGVADPARNAMVQDLAPEGLKKETFSLIYWGHNLGFAVGPLIAGFFFHTAPAWLFWGNALAIGLGTLLLGLFLPESLPSAEALEASHKKGGTDRAHRGNLLSALASRPHLLIYTALGFFIIFVYANNRFALPLSLDALFGIQGSVLYGGQMTLNALLVLVLTPVLNHLTRTWRPLVTIALSCGLFALGFGLLAFALPLWGLFLSTTIWTVGEVLHAVNDEVYLATHTPLSHRARFMAVLPAVISQGWALSPVISGGILTLWNQGVLWVIMASLVGTVGLSFLLFDRWDKRVFPQGAADPSDSPTPRTPA